MNYISPNEIEELINRKRLIVYRKSYIYDITDLLKSHPGGSSSLIKRQLQDCQNDYKFHSKIAKKCWKKYLIGTTKLTEESIFEKILNIFFG